MAITHINSLDFGLSSFFQEMINYLYRSDYYLFFAQSIFKVPLGNVIGAIFVLLLFWMFKRFFSTISLAILDYFTKRTKIKCNTQQLQTIKEPVAFGFAILGLDVFLDLLFINSVFLDKIINSMIFFVVFWGIYNIINALKLFIHTISKNINPDFYLEVGNFIIVIINTIVITIAIVVILSIWGINASAFLASLGIGGIAFALAAKDTASNIFGSISILADGVIKIGEWIKINNIEGVVETIGMRSTKIRTFDKSLISIPNQVIANAQIENFSRRGVRRMKLKVPLPYSSKSEQILKVIEDIKNMLLRNKSIAQNEKSIVNFENFDNNIILISVATFTNTIDTEHFFRIQQDINIKIMQIIEENALWLAQVEDKK